MHLLHWYIVFLNSHKLIHFQNTFCKTYCHLSSSCKYFIKLHIRDIGSITFDMLVTFSLVEKYLNPLCQPRYLTKAKITVYSERFVFHFAFFWQMQMAIFFRCVIQEKLCFQQFVLIVLLFLFCFH